LVPDFHENPLFFTGLLFFPFSAVFFEKKAPKEASGVFIGGKSNETRIGERKKQ